MVPFDGRGARAQRDRSMEGMNTGPLERTPNDGECINAVPQLPRCFVWYMFRHTHRATTTTNNNTHTFSYTRLWGWIYIVVKVVGPTNNSNSNKETE